MRNHNEWRELTWTSGGPGSNYPLRTRKIRLLSTSHIVNIINWVIDRPKQYNHGETLRMFETEMEIRKMISFAKGQRIPIRKPDGYWGFSTKHS